MVWEHSTISPIVNTMTACLVLAKKKTNLSAVSANQRGRKIPG